MYIYIYVHINDVFCCFIFLDLRNRDGRMDGQHAQKQLSLPTVTLGWPSGSINELPFNSSQIAYFFHEFLLSKCRQD